MDYILFETQVNFAEIVAFSICGGIFGIIFTILKGEKHLARAITIFAVFAVCVALSMLNIEKSHIGYQTFLVPLTAFLIAHKTTK